MPTNTGIMQAPKKQVLPGHWAPLDKTSLGCGFGTPLGAPQKQQLIKNQTRQLLHIWILITSKSRQNHKCLTKNVWIQSPLEF